MTLLSSAEHQRFIDAMWNVSMCLEKRIEKPNTHCLSLFVSASAAAKRVCSCCWVISR